ncbi:MAG: DNA translocase FtsK [Hyphomicrobiales bacterium]|nr:DNA translocase FtsK [Hyphomicrobiales bacterium]MDE2113365.1 DNA translocase FtsK [Hyphomicrobiales bacterium]
MRTTSFSSPDYFPEPVRNFAARRMAELLGLVLLAGSGMIAVSLMSWSVADPSLNHATFGPVHNYLGNGGAIVADFFMQLFGLASIALLLPIVMWGWRLLRTRQLGRVRARLGLWLLGSAAAMALASTLPVSGRWPLPTGLGGVLGDALLILPYRLMGNSAAVRLVLALVLAVSTLVALTAAAELGSADAEPEPEMVPKLRADSRRRPPQAYEDELDVSGVDDPGFGIVSMGALAHGVLSVKSALSRMLQKRASGPGNHARAPWMTTPGLDSEGLDSEGLDGTGLPEPGAVHAGRAGPSRVRQEPRFQDSRFQDARFQDSPAPSQRSATAPERPISRGQAAQGSASAGVASPKSHPEELVTEFSQRVAAPASPLRAGKRVVRESQPGLLETNTYELPPLFLMAEAKNSGTQQISEDALEQNARLLEGVLDDFGVKGEIIHVRPGPVVTMYELEPAPGIKSSRVIGLADDIARSMSAISARVAVVQGRNAIGVELPNQRRETVYLRELIGSQDFEKSRHKLAIALGKTIGGEPVIVDLAKMPHLLVAGTTGSGKSVAINTMILSLLYRLKPEECRLIMVDPKMLELSVYDGIPHLLTPVVTDPKKAVVALKWAVREMEDRYKKMSKVGVRNIDGFNARVLEAQAKGEVITRTVQTGYDRETGEAIYEQEQMDLAPLPFIVVIVDEMADLMMVAGKDIEGAIQRLAQMARAAGIHLIMATQRPSVDVITGTIKANFPTRISFQVTSKIDSRTILGEQGGEQLLGQGDMLYMAGGGRISRVHGPFVSDGEVEKIVAHLKTQGQPEYLDAITVEEEEAAAEGEAPLASPGSMDADESADLYDRAVNIVLRDKKCSTSYIQRRLSVGYNKAASLVERMQNEGVVSAPNHSGKREILVGNGVDRGAFDADDED